MVATNIFHYFFYAKNPQHFRILDAWDAGPPSSLVHPDKPIVHT